MILGVGRIKANKFTRVFLSRSLINGPAMSDQLVGIMVAFFLAVAPASAGEGCISARVVCDAAVKSALDCVAQNPLTSLIVCKSVADVKDSVCAQADFTCKREEQEEGQQKK
jgi:hypothetical protein